MLSDPDILWFRAHPVHESINCPDRTDYGYLEA